MATASSYPRLYSAQNGTASYKCITYTYIYIKYFTGDQPDIAHIVERIKTVLFNFDIMTLNYRHIIDIPPPIPGYQRHITGWVLDGYNRLMLLREDDSTVQERRNNVGDEQVNLSFAFLFKVFIIVKTKDST